MAKVTLPERSLPESCVLVGWCLKKALEPRPRLRAVLGSLPQNTERNDGIARPTALASPGAPSSERRGGVAQQLPTSPSAKGSGLR